MYNWLNREDKQDTRLPTGYLAPSNFISDAL